MKGKQREHADTRRTVCVLKSWVHRLCIHSPNFALFERVKGRPLYTLEDWDESAAARVSSPRPDLKSEIASFCFLIFAANDISWVCFNLGIRLTHPCFSSDFIPKHTNQINRAISSPLVAFCDCWVDPDLLYCSFSRTYVWWCHPCTHTNLLVSEETCSSTSPPPHQCVSEWVGEWSVML